MKHIKASVFFISLLVLLALWSLFAAISLWLFVGVLLVWLTIAAIGSSFIQFNYHVKAYCHQPSEKQNKIALTFDDGPNENTREILDILNKNKVKATFFCVGKNIEKHPDIVRQIAAGGHLVGNHSHSHSDYFDFYTKCKIVRELRETDNLVEEITGRKPNFFRPPYGVTTPSIRRALAMTKHKVIGWNIRSMDGVSQDANQIFNRVLKQLSPGSVVLLHDTRVQTNVVLEQLLLSLRAKNYEVVPLDELLDLKAYEN